MCRVRLQIFYKIQIKPSKNLPYFWKQLFAITGEIYAFSKLAGNPGTCIGAQKVVVENLKNSLFNGVVGLRSICCNATKDRLLTKFLNDVLNILENF